MIASHLTLTAEGASESPEGFAFGVSLHIGAPPARQIVVAVRTRSSIGPAVEADCAVNANGAPMSTPIRVNWVTKPLVAPMLLGDGAQRGTRAHIPTSNPHPKVNTHDAPIEPDTPSRIPKMSAAAVPLRTIPKIPMI
jgi:hypothetical protein